MRAYRKARAWLIATPAAEVAKAEAPFFKDIDLPVLTATIATYQKLGNWSPHVEITRPAFEATLDIFQHAGLITKRHKYEDVIAPPPAIGAPGRSRLYAVRPECPARRSLLTVSGAPTSDILPAQCPSATRSQCCIVANHASFASLFEFPISLPIDTLNLPIGQSARPQGIRSIALDQSVDVCRHVQPIPVSRVQRVNVPTSRFPVLELLQCSNAR